LVEVIMTATARKSSVPSKPVQGNASKYESYREAFARIKAAQEAGFYLEAVTIEESVISDRLASWLSANRVAGKAPPKAGASFGNLIARWRELWRASHPEETEITRRIDAIDQWRECRNTLVHAIAKSDPGTATIPVDQFLELAARVAKDGEQHAKAVKKWHAGEFAKLYPKGGKPKPAPSQLEGNTKCQDLLALQGKAS
jgi:hypothetical protein